MIFIDRLTISSALHLLPFLIGERVTRRPCPQLVHFLATPKGNRVYGVFRRFGLVDTVEADYGYLDIMAEDGHLALERVQTRDPIPIFRKIASRWFDSDPLLRSLSRRFDRERLLLFLAKTLEIEIIPTLMRVSIVAHLHHSNDGDGAGPPVLKTSRSFWFDEMKEYAKEHGVELRSYRSFSWPLNLPASGIVVSLVRVLKRGTASLFSKKRGNERPVYSGGKGTKSDPAAPTVAVPFSGRGLSLEPNRNSDLFWVPYAQLEPDQLILYAVRPDSPIDDENFDYLRKAHIRPVSIKKGTSKTPRVQNWPAPQDFRGMLREIRGQWPAYISCAIAVVFSMGVRRWVAHQLFEFVTYYIYWRWFFGQFRVKVHVDPGETAKQRVSADQAIAHLGGVSVSYQRSFEEFFSIRRASALDVHFAFSSSWTELECLSGSIVPQFVSSGYLYDQAFSKTGERAAEIRNNLMAKGAKYVVCFLDQNSGPNKKNGPSHEQRAEDYRELLEKLLSDPEMGLIFKPKKPSDLKPRLGEVGVLLDAAMETGRCYMYQEGNVATDAFPCEASAAADVTIGVIFGSTASMESALSGTPTLLLDREFVGYHPLYELGEGKVVFKDWQSIWNAFQRFRSDPASLPGFGNWDSMLQRLDPYQDGGAAGRMGQYIAWLSDAFKSGMGRKDALAFAKKQYTDTWGSDKVTDLSDYRKSANAGRGFGLEIAIGEPRL